MEEPKALLPNGHSDSHSEDKPEQMEVDEVEPNMKDDIKTEQKQTKSTDSDEATDSSTKTKTNESEKTTNQSFENALKQIEKSSIKKKVPQKIVKRSPRISRNKEPPEKDGETSGSKSEDKDVEKKSDDKSSTKVAAFAKEKGTKEAVVEVIKETEQSEKKMVAASTSEEKKENTATKEVERNDNKTAEADNEEGSEKSQLTGDPDSEFLGFDDPKKSNYNSSRDKLQKMIDELMASTSLVHEASTSGSSRSRRSTTIKRDTAKEVESQQAKASTSESVADKKEPEAEEHLSNWFDRKMMESQPSLSSYYYGCGDDDYHDHEGSGVSNAMLIPEVVYRSGGGDGCGGPRSSAVDDESRPRRSRPSLVAQPERKPSPFANKRNYDVTLPQYLKPFDYGWKRELAYRNNTETSSKRMADVFYYTPLGKKIRSIGSVKDYLLGTDLTLENFTFVTKSMNLNDPDKETITDKRIKAVDKPPTPQLPPLSTRKSSALSRANSADSAAVVNAEETPKTGSLSTPKTGSLSTPKISLKSFRPPPKNKANKTPVSEKSKKSSDDSDNDKDELEMGMLPPLWNESDIRPDWSANGGSTTMNKKSGSGGNVSERGGEGEGEGEDKVEVCSIRCPRMCGQIPTLACMVCLCLYHPECVGVRRSIHNYVCKNCQDANKPSKMPGPPPPIQSSPPPLVPINSSQPDRNQSESSAGTGASTPQLQRLLDGKSAAKPQPKIVGGVTTWLPPSSMIQLTTKSTTTSKMSTTSQVSTVESSSSASAMPAQTLWQMNGKRFLYVPKHNVLSVSPAATTSSASNPSETAVVNTLPSTVTAQSGNLVSPGCVSMPSLIQNSVQSSFLASSLIGKSAPSMSHALIVSDTANPNSNSGVILVPCITASSTSSGSLTPASGGENNTQRILLVNGAGGLPSGNFLIGNLPAQQQPPQQPSTQPANESVEKSSNKRQLEAEKPETGAEVADETPPPAKRSKKETTVPPAAENKEQPAPAAAPKVPEAPTPEPAPAPAEPTPTPPDKATPESVVSVPSVPASSSVSVNKDFFMTNVSAIYHALLNSFQYLKVQELLRAARVCHMWRDVAMNRSLWHVVRLKNSRVRDWDGLANTLRQTGTRHLDMRKMLMPDKSEEVNDLWTKYAAAIDRVNSLWRIDMCRCPAAAIERSARASARLQYLSALAIKSSSLDSSAFENCRNMTELRLKSSEKNGLDLQNLSTLKHLTKMKHLSLTTMKSFTSGLDEVLENMKDLETLELGECSELAESIATKTLPKLKRLQRLRLEKGQGAQCPTIAILESVKDMKNLVQLELINFDIKSGFDTTIAKCTNLRTLLIIPTYVTQSATTNHLVMEGVSKLSKTLTLFVWGITLELLRVTDLFIDQWEGQKGASVKSSSNSKKGSGDSIPILKPISETGNKEGGGGGAASSQVDILQLPKLHKVLTSMLPTTKVKILKVPFNATWRQTVSGPAHIH